MATPFAREAHSKKQTRFLSGSPKNSILHQVFIDNPRAGNYSDAFGSAFGGIYWDLSGTLANGDILDATYFEDDGTIVTAENIQVSNAVTVPEPGTALLTIPAIVLLGGIAVRRRTRKQA